MYTDGLYEAVLEEAIGEPSPKWTDPVFDEELFQHVPEFGADFYCSVNQSYMNFTLRRMAEELR